MACHSGARSGARSRPMKPSKRSKSRANLFRGGRRWQVERLKRLLVALIDDDADARVDNLVALNEQGIVLRFSVRVDLEAGEPGRALEVIDQSHPRNFEVTDGRHIRDDRPDIVGDDAAVVWLRQVDRASRRQILDHLARRAAAQGHCKRHQMRTHNKSTQLPFVRGHCVKFIFRSPRLRAAVRPQRVKGNHLEVCRSQAIRRSLSSALTIWFQNAAIAWCWAARPWLREVARTPKGRY